MVVVLVYGILGGVSGVVVVVYGGIMLPYPSGNLVLDVVLLLLFLGLETLRIFYGWKGNLCERSLASCASLFILLPCAALAVYYLLLQTFVLRLEFLLSAVLLCFYGLEFLLGLLSVSAFSRLLRKKNVEEEEDEEGRERKEGEEKEEKKQPPGLLGSDLPEDPLLLPSIYAVSSVTHMWTTAHKPTKASESLQNFHCISTTRQSLFLGLMDRSPRGISALSLEEKKERLEEGRKDKKEETKSRKAAEMQTCMKKLLQAAPEPASDEPRGQRSSLKVANVRVSSATPDWREARKGDEERKGGDIGGSRKEMRGRRVRPQQQLGGERGRRRSKELNSTAVSLACDAFTGETKPHTVHNTPDRFLMTPQNVSSHLITCRSDCCLRTERVTSIMISSDVRSEQMISSFTETEVSLFSSPSSKRKQRETWRPEQFHCFYSETEQRAAARISSNHFNVKEASSASPGAHSVLVDSQSSHLHSPPLPVSMRLTCAGFSIVSSQVCKQSPLSQAPCSALRGPRRPAGPSQAFLLFVLFPLLSSFSAAIRQPAERHQQQLRRDSIEKPEKGKVLMDLVETDQRESENNLNPGGPCSSSPGPATSYIAGMIKTPGSVAADYSERDAPQSEIKRPFDSEEPRLPPRCVFKMNRSAATASRRAAAMRTILSETYSCRTNKQLHRARDVCT
ncbi:hypothetical protein L3Q82_020236 [Scortum barcoo]|uniref:Uncharacterized protein n=1 Tax=Scortum barcoo TaxID=214431 RepID=A0ACB8V7W6_9TELE|nr:hypothetical protein L3Q82_020236 [Scortum barcoo]